MYSTVCPSYNREKRSCIYIVIYIIHIVVLGLPLLSSLVALLSPLDLKLQTDRIIILHLFCGTVSHRIYAHHVTLSPILNSPVSDLSLIFQPLFFFNSKIPISFTVLFLLSLYSPKGYLRTDISDIDQASLCHITHISLSSTLISLMPILNCI